MSKKLERSKAAPRILDKESRTRQLKHHLESLERDNFVALNEYEAIIATAAAAAAAPGPVSLTTTNIGVHGLTAVGSIIGSVVGTVGPGAANLAAAAASSGAMPSGRTKKNQKDDSGSGSISGANTGGRTDIGGSGSGFGANFGSGGRGDSIYRRRPIVLPKKALSQLLEESLILRSSASIPSYVTANMGPSRYPDRQFCTVCGWKGTYRCGRCGMRYCDLRCLKTHQDTRCMKFTI